VTVPRFGGPDVLRVSELPDPEPCVGEVRIRVAAATVNPTDILLRSGALADRLKDLSPPYIPGTELAGTIDAIGAGVEWQIGERVMAIVTPRRPTGGAQAEYVVVPAGSVARIPAGSTFEEAATLPMNGLTARLALDAMALQPGQTLAITGATGAVGGYAIQLAKVARLRVVAYAKPADELLVRQLGADVVVPRANDVGEAIRGLIPEGVDGVLDAAVIGGAVLPAVRDGGQVVAVRRFEGASERGLRIHEIFVADYLENQAALAGLGELAGSGKLRLRVAELFAPEHAADAHRKLEAGGMRGRFMIVF
jgi:NADPH:quinone reductase-like Zn-dependent oxidoreductase